MKSFTNLAQAKELIKILRIETADMHFWKPNGKMILSANCSPAMMFRYKEQGIEAYPCWSLAALMNAMPKHFWKDHLQELVDTAPTMDNLIDGVFYLILEAHQNQHNILD